MGRQVGAGAQPVAVQDRGDHARRRGLAVGADDVDRLKALAGAGRARSSSGACGPGRSACRTGPSTAESARPPAGVQRGGAPPLPWGARQASPAATRSRRAAHSALELALQLARAVALGLRRPRRAPWPRSRRWPAWPRRARSPLAARSQLRRRGGARRRAIDGHLPSTATCPPGTGIARHRLPACARARLAPPGEPEVKAREARDAVGHPLVARRLQAGGDDQPGGAPRRCRASRAAPDRLDRAPDARLGVRVDQRRIGRRVARDPRAVPLPPAGGPTAPR